MTSWYYYPYKELTGGGDGALDSLDGSLLKDGDGAFIIDSEPCLRVHRLNATSGAAESSPAVIAPDANADDKRWIHATWDPNYINILQDGTGAVSVAINTLMKGFMSVANFGTVGNGTTSDQSAVAAAVLAAYTAGKDLYWPKGTYLTTAAIPYLHSVRHWGPGVIKRGSNLFMVEPNRANTNTLYCSAEVIGSGSKTVDTNADDQYYASSWSKTSNWLYFGVSAPNNLNVCLPFSAVNVPKGAVVTSSHLRMRAYENQGGTLNVNIYLEAADNPTAPTSQADMDARTKTSAVAWDSVGAFVQGEWYLSADITDLVQTVIDQAGWVTGNAINAFIYNNGTSGEIYRGISSYDQSASYAAQLIVNYTYPDEGDGLSWTEPMTPTHAVEYLANYGPTLRGKWDIALSAGTYTTGNIQPPLGLLMEIPVLVYGPDVSYGTPTAIFTQSGSDNYGFRIRNGSKFIFQDVKLSGFDEAYGIAAIGHCLLATINVHTDDCYQGILAYFSRLYVGRGSYRMVAGSQAGIASLYNVLHSIGADYNRDTCSHTVNAAGEGPTIYADSLLDDVYGLYIAENATGHVDGCTISYMDKGAWIRHSSRANFSNCDFQNNECAVECETGSNFTDDGSNTYNEGTADANTRTWRLNSGGVEIGSNEFSITPGMTNWAIDSNITSATCTGSTSAHTFHTFNSFLAGHEFSTGGFLKIRLAGVITNTNGTKTFRVQMGGHTIGAFVFVAAANGDFVIEMNIHQWDTDKQKNFSWGNCSDGEADASVNDYTVTIADGTAQALTVQGVLANASDQIVMHAIEIWRGGH